MVDFIIFILLSTGVGYGVVRLAPWRSSTHFYCLAWPLALALGPFILGLCTILTLVVFGGVSPHIHLRYLALGLLVVAFLLATKKSRWRKADRPAEIRKFSDWLLVSIFLLCVVDVIFLAAKLPLAENDALEYGLVGRAIYDARSLSVYPLLDTSASASGFFAPWTHPPLYSSLIYVAYALQGSAEIAGWMKLIAPWFMLSAAAGVIGMGRLQGVRTAWLAGILFIGVPLLAIGSENAAIDALPVAGMVLLMLSLVGLERKNWLTPIYIGLLVGLGLWTHSQVILYLPIVVVVLFATGGVANWKISLRVVSLALVVVLIVAGYPYLHNMEIYGVPISDNPEVFSLPSLDWAGYFRYTRSIYNWGTRLQYGLLKGLVAVHNYGFVFWLGGLAFVYLIFTGMLGRWLKDVRYMRSMDEGDGFLLVSLAVLVIYHAGVLASMLIGTDLMIKNDRYFLVVTPPIALLAASGIARVIHSCSMSLYAQAGINLRSGALVAVVAVLLIGHACAFLLYGNLAQWAQLLDIRRPESSMSLEISMRKDPLANLNGIKIAQNMHAYISPEALVLAIRPADMYYARRKMVSYLDPIMVPMYGCKDARQLFEQLHKSGVGYIQVPDYFIPPVNNSALMDLISDPRLTVLVQDAKFSQLYALKSLPIADFNEVESSKIDLSALPWREYPRIGVGGPAFALQGEFSRTVQLPATSESHSSLLAKSYSHILEVGDGDSNGLLEGNIEQLVHVIPGKEYVINLDVEGEGFNKVLVWMREPNVERWSGPYFAGDFVLSPQIPSLMFKRRMRMPEGVQLMRIGIERYGISRLTLKKAFLTRLPD
ncbi:MAG: hypothetical protein EKK45_10855 [Curvibacter sp.]|nr:MAG: hypothetical protein EKK45_10855 [Curvibacter sp.]